MSPEQVIPRTPITSLLESASYLRVLLLAPGVIAAVALALALLLPRLGARLVLAVRLVRLLAAAVRRSHGAT